MGCGCPKETSLFARRLWSAALLLPLARRSKGGRWTVQPACSRKPRYASMSRAKLHATWHAVRFVAASFAWTVGSKRPAYIKLTEVIGEPAAGMMPKRCWGYARRALLVQPAWSRKPTYASKSRAKLHAASMRAVSSLHLSHGQSEAKDQHISN